MNLCLLAGGQSTEHQISLISATNVRQVLPGEWKVLTIAITKTGDWLWFPDGTFAVNTDDPEKVRIADGGIPVFPAKGPRGPALFPVQPDNSHPDLPLPMDLVFPVLHGKNGEDGTVQGLLQMLGVPCVGCSMTTSAVGMDKSFTKKILFYDGIPMARWVDVKRGEAIPDVSHLGMPLFVKPANAGSSVGVHKVTELSQLPSAVADALQFDEKALIEEAIQGREIECAVLGNGPALFCPAPGEIIPAVEFYSYEAKYTIADGASTRVPARLTPEETAEVQALAKKIFLLLGGKGFSRVDFFLTDSGKFLFNEINTIPGFTNISMYPKMMQHGGITYPDLIRKLILLAQENFRMNQDRL